MKVETKDALLHAINEEYVEAVEVLLDHEETIHQEGEPWVSQIPNFLVVELFTSAHFNNIVPYYCAVQSWEAIPADTATFTPDITPLILASHR